MRRLLVLAVFACTALGQRPPDLSLAPEERARIVASAADLIERHYVDAVKAKDIAAALRAAPLSAASALALVPEVNRVLAAAGGDKHLRLGYSHEPQEEDEVEDRQAEREEVAAHGYGITGVQRLDGNIALLALSKFHDPALAGDALAAAMRLIAGADALIVDVRDNDGGSPHMVALLMTYLVPDDEPVLISTVENRSRGMAQQYWTLSYTPAPRFAGRPLFVLTSARTWSAGEGFAEHARRLAGATIVGEVTRGGARMSTWMPVHPHFALSVSVARHIGIDWEGKGITPDVSVPEGDALATARRLAAERLGRTAQ
jgi:C-terminal processing protease CtpA/Prc